MWCVMGRHLCGGRAMARRCRWRRTVHLSVALPSSITSQSPPNYETPSVLRSSGLSQRYSGAVSLPPALSTSPLEEAPEELDSPERQEASRTSFCESPQSGRGQAPPGTSTEATPGPGKEGRPTGSAQGGGQHCCTTDKRPNKEHTEGKEKGRSDSRSRRDTRDLRREDSKRESRRTAQEKRELFKAGKEKEGTS